MIRYWKVLDAQGRACHGGTFQYDLPKGSKPGAWTPRIENIEACARGYHLCRDADLVEWCNNATIWAAEPRGRIIVQSDKVVCESVRLLAPTPWDAVTARLFAVECVADVMHLNTDERVVNALEKANKDFEMLVITGSDHGAAETPYGSKRRMDFLVRNLLGGELGQN